MKKIFALLLVFATVFALCGCGKSEEVLAVEEQIAALDGIAYPNKELIDTLKMFDNLTDEEKRNVENYESLVNHTNLYLNRKLVSTADNCISTMEFLARGWETSIGLNLEGKVNYFAIDYMERALSVSEEEIIQAMADEYLIKSPDAYSDKDVAIILSEPSLTIPVIQKIYSNNGTLDSIGIALLEINEVMGHADKNNEYYDLFVDYYASINEMYDYLCEPFGSYIDLGNLIETYSLLISSNNAKLSLY